MINLSLFLIAQTDWNGFVCEAGERCMIYNEQIRNEMFANFYCMEKLISISRIRFFAERILMVI